MGLAQCYTNKCPQGRKVSSPFSYSVLSKHLPYQAIFVISFLLRSIKEPYTISVSPHPLSPIHNKVFLQTIGRKQKIHLCTLCFCTLGAQKNILVMAEKRETKLHIINFCLSKYSSLQCSLNLPILQMQLHNKVYGKCWVLLLFQFR